MYKFYYLFFFVVFIEELDIQFLSNLKGKGTLHQAGVINTGGRPMPPGFPPIPWPF